MEKRRSRDGRYTEKRRSGHGRIAAFVYEAARAETPGTVALQERSGKLARDSRWPPMSICQISSRVTGRTIEESVRLQAAWSEFLLRPAWTWTWFGTFTFKDRITRTAAERDWNRFIRELNTIRFGKRYRKRGETITYARGIEYQRRRVLHFHALIGLLVPRMNQFDAMKIWEQCGSLVDIDEVKAGKKKLASRQPRTGYSRIYEYDPSLGGLNYLTKYVSKGGEITVHCSKKTGLALQLSPVFAGPGHQQTLTFGD